MACFYIDNFLCFIIFMVLFLHILNICEQDSGDVACKSPE